MIWLGSNTNSVDINVNKLQEMVEDRRAWCAAVHGVTKRQTQQQLNNNNNTTCLFILSFWLRWAFIAAQAFSSCREQRLLFLAVCRTLIMMASLIAKHRYQSIRASIVVASELQRNRLSCSVTCGIFPDQRMNLCSPVPPGKSRKFAFQSGSPSGSQIP